MRIRESISIAAPPSDVFRVVATDHFVNHPRWDPNIESMEPMSTQPMGVGSRARVRRRRGGADEVLEVIEHSPPRRFATRDNIGPFVLQMTCDMEPRGDQATRLTLTADTTAKGPMALALPLLSPVFRRQIRKTMRAIRSMAESQT